jgi:hypothetical protein
MMIGLAIMSTIKRIQRLRALCIEKTDQNKTRMELERGQPSSFLPFLINFIYSIGLDVG